jgi:hypothetical protein
MREVSTESLVLRAPSTSVSPVTDALLILAPDPGGAQTTWRLGPKLGVFEKASRICEGDKSRSTDF